MAITGISAISGEQIIAAGAVSAREAATASFTTGGNDIQNLYDTVSTNSASWTGGITGDYISAKGFSQHISNAAGDKFLSFWNEAGGSTATAYPAIYLSGQFGSAYYKDNELRLGRNNHNIAFNIGGQGPKISAGATGTIPSYMYIYNAGNSATISQSGLNLSNSTANENVTIASIQSWNAKGDMHESSFNYDADNKISGYNGSAFATGSELPSGVMVESGLEYNAANEISGYSGSAIAQYGAEKQWLVHDDTLVHAANSAQYALGVNVSAVQSLMNVSPISACVTQVNLTATGNAGAINKVVTKVTAYIPTGWEFMTWTTFRTVGWVGSVYPGGITNSAVDIWGVYGGNYTSTATCKVDCGYLIRKTI